MLFIIMYLKERKVTLILEYPQRSRKIINFVAIQYRSFNVLCVKKWDVYIRLCFWENIHTVYTFEFWAQLCIFMFYRIWFVSERTIWQIGYPGLGIFQAFSLKLPLRANNCQQLLPKIKFKIHEKLKLILKYWKTVFSIWNLAPSQWTILIKFLVLPEMELLPWCYEMSQHLEDPYNLVN